MAGHLTRNRTELLGDGQLPLRAMPRQERKGTRGGDFQALEWSVEVGICFGTVTLINTNDGTIERCEPLMAKDPSTTLGPA
jgi:hypothetical protein